MKKIVLTITTLLFFSLAISPLVRADIVYADSWESVTGTKGTQDPFFQPYTKDTDGVYAIYLTELSEGHNIADVRYTFESFEPLEKVDLWLVGRSMIVFPDDCDPCWKLSVWSGSDWRQLDNWVTDQVSNPGDYSRKYTLTSGEASQSSVTIRFEHDSASRSGSVYLDQMYLWNYKESIIEPEEPEEPGDTEQDREEFNVWLLIVPVIVFLVTLLILVGIGLKPSLALILALVLAVVTFLVLNFSDIFFVKAGQVKLWKLR